MKKLGKITFAITLTFALAASLSGCGGANKFEDKKFSFYSEAMLTEQKSRKSTYAYSFIVNPDAPSVIICPGGGYANVCMDYEGTDVAEYLNGKGYNAFVLKYRVGRNAKASAPQDDLAALVKYVQTNAKSLGLNNLSYAVMGFSAGGHLAATFGATSTGYAHYGLPKPELMILSYPVITMGEETHKPSRKRLLGRNSGLRELYSAERQVNADYPPTFVWCCEDDIVVKPENSALIASALKEANVPCNYVEYSRGGHGIGLAEGKEAQGWLDKALEFWVGQQ